METYDDETIAQTLDFMRRAVKADKPFFIWHNTTRTHTFTHLRPEYEAMVPEIGFMGAAMTEFDNGIGQVLDELDSLGIDRQHHRHHLQRQRRHAVLLARRGHDALPERERRPPGRVDSAYPCVVRWPGVIEPGTVINDIFHHMDWIPTLMAALGEPDIKEKLLAGYQANGQDLQGAPRWLQPAGSAQG